MIRFNRYILLDLHVVDTLQDGKAMADADDAHLFQFVMLECYQSLSHNLVFCAQSC